MIGAGLEIDRDEGLKLADVRAGPMLVDIGPGDPIGIGPDAVGAHIKMLRSRRDEAAGAELIDAARGRPDHAALALIRRLDRAVAFGIDEVEHVGIDRAQRRDISLGAVVAADETAQEALLAAQRRIIEIDDQAIAGLDDQDAVLVLVIETHRAHPRRNLPPAAIGHYLDREAERGDAVANFGMIVIGQQHDLVLRQLRQRIGMKMIGLAVRDPEIFGRHHRRALALGQRPVERPGTEIAGAIEPRIGRQHGTIIVVEHQRGVAECFKSEAHQRRLRGTTKPLRLQRVSRVGVKSLLKVYAPAPQDRGE